MLHVLLWSSVVQGEVRLNGDGSAKAAGGQVVADLFLCKAEATSLLFISFNIRMLVLISWTSTTARGSIIITVVGKQTTIAMVLHVLMQMGVFSVSVPIIESGMFPCMHYH